MNKIQNKLSRASVPALMALSGMLFSIHLAATANSVAVPREFMVSGKTYAYEVLAIEASGNQTLSSAMFSTQ